MTTSERIAKGQYTDGNRWYLTSGVPIRGTEGNYSDIMDIASEEATRPERQRQERALMEQNLEYNLGPNWRDIYDLDTRQYKDGYSAADGDGGRLAIIAQGGTDIGSRYGGGSQSSRGYYESEQLRALREAQEEAEAARRAQFEQNSADLRKQTDAAKRNAYVAYMQGQKNLPQTMAAAGYTGGITETTASGLAGDYQQALTDLENQYASNLAQLQANLDAGIAQDNAAYNQQIAAALAAIEQNQYNRELDAINLALQREKLGLTDQQIAATAADQTGGVDYGTPTGSGQPTMTYEDPNTGAVLDYVNGRWVWNTPPLRGIGY